MDWNACSSPRRPLPSDPRAGRLRRGSPWRCGRRSAGECGPLRHADHGLSQRPGVVCDLGTHTQQPTRREPRTKARRDTRALSPQMQGRAWSARASGEGGSVPDRSQLRGTPWVRGIRRDRCTARAAVAAVAAVAPRHREAGSLDGRRAGLSRETHQPAQVITATGAKCPGAREVKEEAGLRGASGVRQEVERKRAREEASLRGSGDPDRECDLRPGRTANETTWQCCCPGGTQVT